MSAPATPPERYLLHQDPDGTIWAGSDDGTAWVQLPGHVARMIHERDHWHDTATAHLRRIGELMKERDAWERYGGLLEDEVYRLNDLLLLPDASEANVTDEVLDEFRDDAGITEEMLA